MSVLSDSEDPIASARPLDFMVGKKFLKVAKTLRGFFLHSVSLCFFVVSAFRSSTPAGSFLQTPNLEFAADRLIPATSLNSGNDKIKFPSFVLFRF